MFTSTNRFIEDEQLEFLTRDAFTGGLDLLHHWKDKKFFVNAKIAGQLCTREAEEAITALAGISCTYYQRPGADYLDYDNTRTSLSGHRWQNQRSERGQTDSGNIPLHYPG